MSTDASQKKPSKSSSKAKNKPKKALDAPFDPQILKRAKSIAAKYRLLISPDPDVGYLGRTIELPYVMGDGDTIEACAEMTREATIGMLATMLEAGERPPTPASEAKRDRQLNVRLTADEKDRLEEAARVAGFRSVSDFVRYTALRSA